MLRADDGVQIGVVSLVPGQCENPTGSISTFTSVARNLQWIRSTMYANEANDQLAGGSIPLPANSLPTTLDGLLSNFKN